MQTQLSAGNALDSNFLGVSVSPEEATPKGWIFQFN